MTIPTMNDKALKHRPTTLIILDGWGYSESSDANAIHHANTPVWDQLWSSHPHGFIHGSGNKVGLPDDQMGNSEVGHLNLGAGRVVYQSISRINEAIKDGSFYENEAINQAIDQAISHDKAVHIVGLLSVGGVHSHEDQIHAAIKSAAKRGARQIYLHAFLDGRDTPPKSAANVIAATEQLFSDLGVGHFASIIGRYYGMDRDQRWDRVQQSYDLMSHGKAAYQAPSASHALEMAYERDEVDEFVKATLITDDTGATHTIQSGDSLIFMNFRADRARQLVKAYTDPDFSDFDTGHAPTLGNIVCLTEYSADIKAAVAFPPESLNNVFGAYIADLGLTQLRIAETEKYAHVTFFFNGGQEQPFKGEDRLLIKSPDVATYDLQPQMNAPQLTDELTQAIEGGRYDTIICNYANADMVGHTGNFDAAVQAIEALDQCLGRIIESNHKAGGEILITADHGNAEKMHNSKTNQAHTAHTSNVVPLIYVGREATVSASGALSDIAPTLLYLMGITQPDEMTGHSLVTLTEA